MTPPRRVPCAGDPIDGRGCPGSASRFVLSPAAVVVGQGDDDAAEMGWVLIAFCSVHRRAVLDYVREHVGPDLWTDSVVADLGALPVVVDQLGLGEHLDNAEPVLTNLGSVAS